MEEKIKIKDKRARYAKVWLTLLIEFNLSPSEGLFLCLIHDLSRKTVTGGCEASKKYLADSINVTPPTINNHINFLISIDLIEKLPKKLSHGVVAIKPTKKLVEKIRELEREVGSKEHRPGTRVFEIKSGKLKQIVTPVNKDTVSISYEKTEE